MVDKNKKGWIRIIEAFFGILLITLILLVILEKNLASSEESSKIYQKENLILREIELNDSLRDEILNAGSLPIEWNDFESNGLGKSKNKITDRTPNYLACRARLCWINERCNLNQSLEEDVYASSVRIFANEDVYSPRELRLFCWKN